ncbi:MAG: MotA/TolQ/ExbB proton channel family protein, partial [Planctomycetota bacterium]
RDSAVPDADAAAGQPLSEETGDNASLGQIILDSGWSGIVFYALLLIFSIVAMTVTLERLVKLRRSRILPREFANDLHALVQRNEADVRRLRQLSEGSEAPVAKVLWAGVLRAGRPLPEVEKAMEDAAARELASMRSRNRPLSVIGQIAPLVGLLGTVVGMIIAFRISSQAGLGKAELLAKGIYIALMTTAAGLSIAIPCLLAAAWFNTLVDRFFREIDECLLETMPSFARVEERTPVNLPAPTDGESVTSATPV